MNYNQNNIVNQIDFYCYEKFNDLDCYKNFNDLDCYENFNEFDLLHIPSQKTQIYFNRTKHDGINVYKETKTTNLINMMEYYVNNDVGTPVTYSSNICKCGLFHKVKLIYSERCG